METKPQSIGEYIDGLGQRSAALQQRYAHDATVLQTVQAASAIIPSARLSIMTLYVALYELDKAMGKLENVKP